MNFSDFSDELADEFGITKSMSKKILSFLTKRIRRKIIFGIEITFREIGTFKLRVREPKKFLNFQTNKMDLSKKCFYLDFAVTDKMKEKLKNKTIS